jgi:hypothetical protein
MDYVAYFVFFPALFSFALYMSAYVEDTRIGGLIQAEACYAYVKLGKLGFFFWRKKIENRRGMIRKITRDREIISLCQFPFSSLLLLIIYFISFVIGIDKYVMPAAEPLIIIIFAFSQLRFYEMVREKCINIAKTRRNTVEVTDKSLARHARNIMREKYEGENKVYSLSKEEKHTFWYDYTEYYLCVDGKREKMLAKQQKYRYSSIVETEWLTGRI